MMVGVMRLIIPAVLLLGSTDALAQAGAAPGALWGYVQFKDAATPLTIAELEIPALQARTRVDSNGRYSFPAIPPGRYLVIARAIGFSPRGDSITVTAGSNLSRHFDLPAAATRLDTAMILAKTSPYISPAMRSFEARRLSGMGGRFIPEEELRRSDSREFMEVIRKLPGMSITRRNGSTYLASARRSSSAKGVFRGAAGTNISDSVCYATIYVDAVLRYDQAMMQGSSPPRLEEFNVREYAGIEYYAGEASVPAQFKASVCGVLLLWSRER
jgi:hypothetical protein